MEVTCITSGQKFTEGAYDYPILFPYATIRFHQTTYLNDSDVEQSLSEPAMDIWCNLY